MALRHEIGRSVEGRPIEVWKLGPSRPVGLLVFGAIHGDEPGSAELCRRYFAHLEGLRLGESVIVIPVVNPDGLQRNTKDNARGVDLNRNFPSNNWHAAHPPGYFPGSAPLSEPESEALAQLIEAAEPRVLVAVHQPFRCVNWDGPAEALANEMAEASGYPAVASVGYPTPGSFGSRYGVDLGRPTITLELPRPVAAADYEAGVRALERARMWPGP